MIQGGQFSFQNIGPIESAQLELGALTIIAGRNNSGKSYITHTLFGFLWMLDNGKLMHLPGMAERYADHPILTKAHFDRLSRYGEVSFHFDPRLFSRHVSEFLNLAGSVYSKFLHHVYSSTESKFSNAKFEGQMFPSALERREPPLSHFPHKDFVITKTRHDHEKNSSYDLSIRMRDGNLKDTYYLNGQLSLMIEAILFTPLLPRPIMLTSERAAICLFNKELDYSKNQLIRELRTANKTVSKDFTGAFARYTLPVHENITYARRLSKTLKKTGFLAREGITQSLDLVEKMMGAKYKLQHDEIRLVSAPDVGGDSFDIPFHMGSSSSRELALLHYYLKHDAQENDLLFIDEPETHLDSHNQILLARMIAGCVGAGLHVVVTTHSEVMINEFNILLSLNSGRFNREKFYELHPEYRRQPRLDPKSVRAYVCADKKIKECDRSSQSMGFSSIQQSSAHQAEIKGFFRE